MRIVIKENFVPQDFFTKMQSLMLGEEFPWYFSEPIDMDQLKPDLLCDPLDNFQLCHTFYANDKPVSSFYPVFIKPFVKALGMRHLIRIKLNLNLRTQNIIKQGFHVDNNYHDSFTSILYVNTNDGYTEFENGKKVESVENRLVTFDTPLRHTGTSCTNQKYRLTLNLNYY